MAAGQTQHVADSLSGAGRAHYICACDVAEPEIKLWSSATCAAFDIANISKQL